MGTGNCVPIYWQTKKGIKYVRHAYFDQNANELLPTGKSSCKKYDNFGYCYGWDNFNQIKIELRGQQLTHH